MPFIDREKEMAALESAYANPAASLFVVYGRRRVGKTTLLAEFCKGKRVLYYLATEESITSNRAAFREMAADFLQNELLRSAKDASWETIFSTLFAQSCNEKTVIVLDEFQYLGKADKAFPSVFQRIWDTQLKSKNVEVILCGSLVHMMMEQTLSYSSPLYGRRTGQIKLKQIPYAYYKQFFPEMQEQELILYYAVTGGVPKYIELFHQGSDIYNAIYQNVFTPQSFLYEEPEFLLRHEVQDIGSYFSIIRSVAAGNCRLSDIAASLSISATSLPKPLKTLCDLDILEREVPPTEKNVETSKKGQYRIRDNFLAFWFRFVYPMRSFIESGHAEIAMQRLQSGFITNHVGYVYEDICRNKMWELNAQGKLPFLFDRVGRWWGGKDTEIDIVALDTNDRSKILFGECKFHQNTQMQLSELRRLMSKAAAVQWGTANREEYFILFCISGYSEELCHLAESDPHILLG
ncbi:ATP-binding protein [Gemmiger sp.]